MSIPTAIALAFGFSATLGVLRIGAMLARIHFQLSWIAALYHANLKAAGLFDDEADEQANGATTSTQAGGEERE